MISQFNPGGRQTEKKEYWIKHHRVVKRVHTFFVDDDKSPIKEREKVTYNGDWFIKSQKIRATNTQNVSTDERHYPKKDNHGNWVRCINVSKDLYTKSKKSLIVRTYKYDQ